MTSTSSTTPRSALYCRHGNCTQTPAKSRVWRAGRPNRRRSIWPGRSSTGIGSENAMTLQLAPGHQGSGMADEYENDEARLEAARRAVERWETEGGAQGNEQPVERTR